MLQMQHYFLTPSFRLNKCEHPKWSSNVLWWHSQLRWNTPKNLSMINMLNHTAMKWKHTIAVISLLVLNNSIAQNVGIGTATPDPSARVEIYSTNSGLLIPRLTTAQRNAIVNPANALIIFNIDSFCLDVYNADSMRWYKLSCPVQCPPCGTNNCTPPSCSINIIGPDTVCRGDTVLFVAQGCPNVSWRLPSGCIPIGSLTSDSITVVVDTVGADSLVAQS